MQAKSETIPRREVRGAEEDMFFSFILREMNALHYYNPTTTSPNLEPATAALHAMQGKRQRKPDPLKLTPTSVVSCVCVSGNELRRNTTRYDK